jgi:hypothetical protein
MIGFKLGVNQQPISATKETMIQERVASLKGMTCRLDQEGNAPKASGSFRSKSNQCGGLAYMTNNIRMLIRLSCRAHCLHFI